MSRGGARRGTGPKVGSQNVRTLAFAEALHKKLQGRGLDIWDAFADIAKDKNESTQNRLKALDTLASYTQAKLSHMTVQADIDVTERIAVIEVTQYVSSPSPPSLRKRN